MDVDLLYELCQVEMQCMLSVLLIEYEAFLVSTLMFDCAKKKRFLISVTQIMDVDQLCEVEMQ